MPSSALLKALGLNFSPNQLALPEGSLLNASNVVIRRDNIIESRRGFKLYGDALPPNVDRIKQLLTYKGRLLRHFADTIQFDSGTGTFTAFSGNYSEVESGLRIKGIESNGNFYFTTSNGIQKISAANGSDLSSASGYIKQAGGVKGVDLTATVKTTLGDQTSFFTADSALAYRIVWGIKDANNNLILGAPSQRAEVYNSLLTLLLQDYLRILGATDDINDGTTLVSDGDYVNTLKLTSTSTAVDLRNKLIDFATKLDEDILYANDSGTGAPLTIDTTPSAITSGVATVTFTSGDATDYFVIGSNIYLTDFTATSDPTISEGPQVVSEVTTTYIKFLTAATGTLTPGADPTIISNEYRIISQPAIPDFPTPNSQLIEIQTYLQNILSRLQVEPDTVITSTSKNDYLIPIDLTTASTVQLEITIPQDITSDYFYQVYRSAVTSAEGVLPLDEVFPNDELQLVYEAFPTQSELDLRTIVLEDVTPDEFRGANLYTNALSGEGILQANDLPPFAKDINRFKDTLFYANTKTRHRKNMSLLGVTNMLADYNNSIVPKLTISTVSNFNTYSFVSGAREKTDITCIADVADSLNGTYFLINSVDNDFLYYVWYKTSGGALSDPAVSGRTGLRVNISTGATNVEVAEKTRDVLAELLEEFTATSALNVVTVENTVSGYTDDAEVGTSGFTISITTDGRGEKISREETDITCVADVASSLAGTYFELNTAFDKEMYYVWFKVTGVGSDPAIANKTGILVNVLTNDTAASVATAIKTVLDTSYSDKFISNTNIATLTISNYSYGESTDVAAGTSGFTISKVNDGALEVLLSDLVSPAKAVDETARSLVRIINKNTNENVYAYYLSGAQDVPGKMLFEARVFENNAIYFVTNNTNTGRSFNPDLSPTNTNISSITVGSPSTMTVVTSTPHGLVDGDTIIISNSNSSSNIDGIHDITYVNTTTFRLPITVTISGNQGSFSLLQDVEVSENETKANRIYYSKTQQPEAVPIVNYFDVGPENKAILRIFPLRDSLFIFKEDGLYRISGEVAPFSKALFDSSCVLSAPDSLDVANNQLYGWTTQGISIVTEAGVSIISRPIDTEILKLSSSGYPNFKTLTWGVGYESDNSYLVFTNSTVSDEYATICYRYSNLTNSWTTFDKTNTCGVINSQDDRLYLGAGDVAYVEQERKGFNRYDYADREVLTNLSDNKFFGTMIQLSGVTNINKGDVLIQEQTLTIYEFNKLLNKLDIDVFLSDTDYSSSLAAVGGDNLYLKVDSLINKIAFDAGRLAQAGAHSSATYTALSPTSSTFVALKNNYNSVITLLNSDTGVGYANYQELDNDTTQEAVIISVNNITKQITLNTELEYIVGPMTVFNAIESTITYAPFTFNDPLSLKQIREATLMFINKAFTNAMMSFASDLLPSDSEIEFNGDGSGIFGHQSFGSNFFGGTSHGAPFRTYVPRNKQRCRYLICKFTHKIAREQYGILGLTLTGEATSTRAYR